MWYTHACMGWVPGAIKDVDQLWVAARALLDSQNPYDLIGPGRAFPFAYPLAYPVTTAVAVLPLGLLPLEVARLVFVGLGRPLPLGHRSPRLADRAPARRPRARESAAPRASHVTCYSSRGPIIHTWVHAA